MTLISGLHVGTSGLQTSQNALNATAHNLSNLETKANKPARTFVADTYKDYRNNPKGVVKVIEGYDDGQAEAKKLEKGFLL